MDTTDRLLKKDVWYRDDIELLLMLSSITTGKGRAKWLELLDASVTAKKLTAKWDFTQDRYSYDPLDIMRWAIDKQLNLPDEFLSRYDLSTKPKPKVIPAYLDTDHPLHSKELSIAIEAWEAVFQSNPSKPKKTGTRKQLVETWLEANHPELNASEKKRITTMINPDKAGGAPKTE